MDDIKTWDEAKQRARQMFEWVNAAGGSWEDRYGSPPAPWRRGPARFGVAWEHPRLHLRVVATADSAEGDLVSVSTLDSHRVSDREIDVVAAAFFGSVPRAAVRAERRAGRLSGMPLVYLFIPEPAAMA